MNEERKFTRKQFIKASLVLGGTIALASCNTSPSKNLLIAHEILEMERKARYEKNHHPKLEGKEILLPHAIPVPFKKEDLPVGLILSEGYMYSPQEVAIHGFKVHGALDIEARYETPVYCPVDNLWVISSYNSIKLKGINESTRTYKGQEINWGLGYFVQGYLDNGIQLQFAHLSDIAKEIPFSKPLLIDGGWQPTNNNLNLNQPENNLCIARLGKGDLLGWVGCSGLQLGPNYDYKEGDARPTQREPKDNSWDSPHLHLEFYVRDPKTGMKIYQIDPLGIYSWIEDYPPTNAHGNLVKDPILQMDPSGQPSLLIE